MGKRNLDKRKHEIRDLRTLFGKKDERFQIESTSLDELKCYFMTDDKNKHEIICNITVFYPDVPPMWFADTDDAIIAATIQSLSTTTGTDNHLVRQIGIMLKELCQGFNLPEPTEDLEQLAKISNAEFESKLSSSPEYSLDDEEEEVDMFGFDNYLDGRTVPTTIDPKCDTVLMIEDKRDKKVVDMQQIVKPKTELEETCQPHPSQQQQQNPNQVLDAIAAYSKQDSANARLLKEVQLIHRSENFKKGTFKIEYVDDSLGEWNVQLKYVNNSTLSRDLALFKAMGGIDYIQLNLMFMKFPIYPPKARVVCPLLSGSCILPNGVIRLQLLQKEPWNSKTTAESIIMGIVAMFEREDVRIVFGQTSFGPPALSESTNQQQVLANALVKNMITKEICQDLKPPVLASLSYTIDLLQELDYKYMVLQLLWNKTQPNSLMCELRMALFVAAAKNPNHEKCLMPFPSCFFDPVKKVKQFDLVTENIQLVPKLNLIQETTDLPYITWQLLHWIFTNPLSLQPLTENISETITQIKGITGLKIPVPDNNCTFMFNIFQTQPKQKFREAKEKHNGNTFFAFHGSPLNNFHSIIHRGLVSALNVRSSYGFGTYMSSELSVSRSYSGNPEGWVNSAFGYRIQCVAICEVVSAPEVKAFGKYFVCANDEYMQLSHLLLLTT